MWMFSDCMCHICTCAVSCRNGYQLLLEVRKGRQSGVGCGHHIPQVQTWYNRAAFTCMHCGHCLGWVYFCLQPADYALICVSQIVGAVSSMHTKLSCSVFPRVILWRLITITALSPSQYASYIQMHFHSLIPEFSCSVVNRG